MLIFIYFFSLKTNMKHIAKLWYLLTSFWKETGNGFFIFSQNLILNDFSQGCKTIDCKLVLRKKLRSDGSIEFKTRESNK